MINVDFRGFRDAVNEIGCVYTDVDRALLQRQLEPERPVRDDQHRPRLPEAVRQGRARLRPLPPHRHRHRARGAPAGLPAPGEGPGGRRQAALQAATTARRSSSKYTRSDIHGRSAVISLLQLAAYSAGSPISEIHFPARVGASYVTASSGGGQARDAGVPRRQGVERPAASRPRLTSTARAHHSTLEPARHLGRRAHPGTHAGEERARAHDLLPEDGCAAVVVLDQLAARLQDLRPAFEVLVELQDRHPGQRRGARRVLRHSGHDLEGPADHQEPRPRCERCAAAS